MLVSVLKENKVERPIEIIIIIIGLSIGLLTNLALFEIRISTPQSIIRKKVSIIKARFFVIS